MLDSDGALKSICLSCSIIARDGTSEEQACAIRNMRTVLAITSNTLATLRLSRAQVWKQLHKDETSWQQKSLVNVVIVMLDSDFSLKSICLSCSIIARDGTAEEQACAIIVHIVGSRSTYPNHPGSIDLSFELEWGKATRQWGMCQYSTYHPRAWMGTW